MAAMGGDIVISVSADVSPLASGAGKGVSALVAMEKGAKDLERQLLRVGEAGVAFQRKVAEFAGISDKVANSARNSAAAFQEFDNAKASIDRLRASYDPLFAASQRYESAVRELDAALEMGVIQGRQHTQMVEALGQAYLGAGTKMDAARSGMGALGGMSGQLRSNIQNVGFQVQDFAVQVAGGTDATRAFSQQFPQLASAFGIWGVAIGTATAVALPLLVAWLGKTENAAKGVEESNNKMAESLSRLNELASNFSAAGLTDMIEKYGKVDAALLLMIEHQRQFEIAVADAAARDAIRQLSEAYGDLLTQIAEGRGNRGAANDLAEQLGISKEKAIELKAALDEANAAADFSSRAAALSKVNTILAESAIKASDLAGAALNAEDTLRQLAEAAPNASWMNAAIDGVANLLEKVRAALGLTQALSGAAGSGGPAHHPDGGGGNANPYGMTKPGFIAPFGNINFDGRFGAGLNTDTGGGGGGGGGEDPLMANLERIRNSLATQAELEQQAYAESQATLQQALDAKRLSLEEYQSLTEAAQKQHQEKMTAIDAMQYGTSLDKAGAFLGSMATALQGGNERMLKISKTFGAAQALISAWQGAAEALKLPFPANLAAFSQVLATGMGAVNAIKGAGGGGGGGGASGGRIPTAAAAQSPATANITLVGQTISTSSAADMINKLNEAFKQGYKLNVSLA